MVKIIVSHNYKLMILGNNVIIPKNTDSLASTCLPTTTTTINTLPPPLFLPYSHNFHHTHSPPPSFTLFPPIHTLHTHISPFSSLEGSSPLYFVYLSPPLSSFIQFPYKLSAQNVPPPTYSPTPYIPPPLPSTTSPPLFTLLFMLHSWLLCNNTTPHYTCENDHSNRSCLFASFILIAPYHPPILAKQHSKEIATASAPPLSPHTFQPTNTSINLSDLPNNMFRQIYPPRASIIRPIINSHLICLMHVHVSPHACQVQ